MKFSLWLEDQDVTRKYAQDLISGKANPYKDTEPAYYDAYFNGENPPYFNMIVSKQSGSSLGYLAFLHFLNYVGVEKEFFSSKFTSAGKALFDKSVKNGLIQPIDSERELTGKTCWKVIKDPMQILKQIAYS